MTMLVDRLFDKLVQHLQFLTVINSLVFVVRLFCTYTVTDIFLITLICCHNLFLLRCRVNTALLWWKCYTVRLNIHKNWKTFSS